MPKFECQPNCGKCCTGEGFVYLNDADVERLAAGLHWSPETFKLKFCQTTEEGHLILDNGRECRFLQDGWKCTVQAFKPTQCRTFPFWPNVNLNNVAEWCPGVGIGKEYKLSEIRKLEKETAEVLPGYQIQAR